MPRLKKEQKDIDNYDFQEMAGHCVNGKISKNGLTVLACCCIVSFVILVEMEKNFDRITGLKRKELYPAKALRRKVKEKVLELNFGLGLENLCFVE